MTVATARPQTAMKRLAGALSFVCLVLFLLAIEQKHTVAAWEMLRDETGPAMRRVAEWAGRLPSGAADGIRGLRTAVAGEPRLLAAEPGSTVILQGEYRPADEATRAVTGSLALVGAELRFENGEILRTRPLRIASGHEAFAPGQAFADRLNAPADAQIELREVLNASSGQMPARSGLCGGEPVGVAALLHRRDREDLMLFRSRTVGSDTPPTALCGLWSFTAR